MDLLAAWASCKPVHGSIIHSDCAGWSERAACDGSDFFADPVDEPLLGSMTTIVSGRVILGQCMAATATVIDVHSGGRVGDCFVAIGDWATFSLRAKLGVFSRDFHLREVLSAAVNIGTGSLGVVAVTGLFIGMVLAVQAYSQFHQIGMDTSLGAVIHLSVIRELGPVLTAVMLAGRVGSAMAAQLGTMNVTEQLDALACLGVDPVRYLVTPRFVACVLMIPLLAVIANIMGLAGSTAICLHVFGIDSHHYWEHAREYVCLWDLFDGLVKVTIFGAALSLIACHRGFHCRPGAEGVGRAATEAFVLAFIAILALDFVLGLVSNALHMLIFPPTIKAI
jgi:phospholipid/cholesterol/gamma-HCH transport system permease protein